MRKYIVLLVFTFFVVKAGISQQVTISGTITDAKTGEALIAANIYDSNTLSGTTTNLYGFYSIKFSRGNTKIIASYIGYQPFISEMFLYKDTTINISLIPAIELEEVVVTDQGPVQTVRSTQMGMMQLDLLKTEQIPALLGEPDIIKTLQLMPGVQGGTEGTSGFYVRGGGPDQNLILLDGVPVYNVNHLFGFMSVFNSSAIRNVTLIKGGFPARYGGRLSSVLDIRMKEGNNQEFKVDGSIGIISSALTLEGPIIKNNTSFMVSGRRSYFDIFTYPFQIMANRRFNENGKTWLGYFLQDFNGKINHRINDRQRLYFSIYTGKDKFFLNDRYDADDFFDGTNNYRYKYKDQVGLQWGNFTSAIRWNYIISNELFSNITATVSNYRFRVFNDYLAENYVNGQLTDKNDFFFEYYSQIRDYSIKADFDYIPNSKNYIRFGANNTLHYFSPGVTVVRDNYADSGLAVDTTYGNVNIPANEFFVYVEDDYTLNNFIKINFGIHYSNFIVQNATYHSFEPRISGRFMVSNNLSIKASYVKMQQYLHLLANSSLGLPTDLWVPVTSRIKPQKAYQVALGGTYSLNNVYEFTIEGYYKGMKNLIDYAEGASFFELNQGNWEDLVTSGVGESYGVEFFIQKATGAFSGWIGYTLSWSNRKFEEISFGMEYPYRYDSRHDISVVASYKINDRVDLGAAWVYRTGFPFTLEDEKYFSPLALFKDQYINYPDYFWNSRSSDIVSHFDKRNNYRMPNYHRLDLGMNLHKEKRKSKRIWSVGAYNVYGRANPFMIYTSEQINWETGESKTQLKQLSIFTFIPYIRWSIKF